MLTLPPPFPPFSGAHKTGETPAQTIDEHTPTGPEGRNCHYEIPKSRGSWAASMPRLESKLVVRVDDTEDAPLAEHFAAINDFVSQAIGQGGQ